MKSSNFFVLSERILGKFCKILSKFLVNFQKWRNLMTRPSNETKTSFITSPTLKAHKFGSSCVSSSESWLRMDWLGNEKILLGLPFWDKFCQNNQAIGNWHLWTKLNRCQIVTSLNWKWPSSNNFNWPILINSEQLIKLVSFLVHNVT